MLTGNAPAGASINALAVAVAEKVDRLCPVSRSSGQRRRRVDSFKKSVKVGLEQIPDAAVSVAEDLR
jgi:hypothetical protein